MNHTHEQESNAEQRLREKFGKREPFSVPEGYFENLTARVMENAIKSKKPVLRPWYMKPMVKSIAAAAAVFIVALVITLVFTGREEANEYAEYSIKDVYEYNLSNLAELEEAYILYVLSDEEMTGSYSMETEFNEISNEDIIEYLLAENHIEYLIINE